MSNALSTLPTLSEIGSTSVAVSVLQELTRSSDYLPRIQLFQGGSNAAKQGKVRPGNYGIPRGEEVDDLGESIDVLVITAKAKALDTSGDSPIESNDSQSAEFLRIKEQADNVKDSGCMYGLEFLVYERSTGAFYTYFASSESARREATKLIDPKGQILRMNFASRFIKKQYSWHAPVFTTCSTPFANDPTLEQIKAQVEKFQRAPKGREEVPAGEAPKSRRAR